MIPRSLRRRRRDLRLRHPRRRDAGAAAGRRCAARASSVRGAIGADGSALVSQQDAAPSARWPAPVPATRAATAAGRALALPAPRRGAAGWSALVVRAGAARSAVALRKRLGGRPAAGACGRRRPAGWRSWCPARSAPGSAGPARGASGQRRRSRTPAGSGLVRGRRRQRPAFRRQLRSGSARRPFQLRAAAMRMAGAVRAAGCGTGVGPAEAAAGWLPGSGAWRRSRTRAGRRGPAASRCGELGRPAASRYARRVRSTAESLRARESGSEPLTAEPRPAADSGGERCRQWAADNQDRCLGGRGRYSGRATGWSRGRACGAATAALSGERQSGGCAAAMAASRRGSAGRARTARDGRGATGRARRTAAGAAPRSGVTACGAGGRSGSGRQAEEWPPGERGRRRGSGGEEAARPRPAGRRPRAAGAAGAAAPARRQPARQQPAGAAGGGAGGVGAAGAEAPATGLSRSSPGSPNGPPGTPPSAASVIRGM